MSGGQEWATKRAEERAKKMEEKMYGDKDVKVSKDRVLEILEDYKYAILRLGEL